MLVIVHRLDKSTTGRCEVRERKDAFDAIGIRKGGREVCVLYDDDGGRDEEQKAIKMRRT